jgi:EAL domain-containing protein (putative c-di-GMP-specific phosphodiesterase class I)/FixJ family two-component response regulator
MTPAADASQRPLHERLVLIVEDSALQRGNAVQIAQELGAAQVLQAGDGIEGLEQLGRHPGVDLVITDLEMPRMDGIRFIGEFAARGYRPALVIASSHGLAVLNSVRLMAETYGLAVPGVITKPLAAEALGALLNSPPALEAMAGPAAQNPAGGARIREELSLARISEGIRAGEFACYYQPQVTFKGALLRGAEALLRWRHPEHGLLGPAAFLPQAETSVDLMADLTGAVLADVAAHWQDWRRHGMQMEVAVNLSGLSLSTGGFAEHLLETCTRLDLPPRTLVFEVTETASLSNLGHSLANLARLRMNGFRLSIDDFGTGFSTFEQLERIPFTELKIDRSLTRNLPDGERARVLVQGLLKIARDLGLSTVAEGVETLAAWWALAEMGCERAQGFLFARPMPADQVLDWARQDRSHLRPDRGRTTGQRS